MTETRLFTMGMPYSPASLSATCTMFSAFLQTVSYTFFAVFSAVPPIQGNKEIPIVIVRMSRCSRSIMSMVSKTSNLLNMSAPA